MPSDRERTFSGINMGERGVLAGGINPFSAPPSLWFIEAVAVVIAGQVVDLLAAVLFQHTELPDDLFALWVFRRTLFAGHISQIQGDVHSKPDISDCRIASARLSRPCFLSVPTCASENTHTLNVLGGEVSARAIPNTRQAVIESASLGKKCMAVVLRGCNGREFPAALDTSANLSVLHRNYVRFSTLLPVPIE